MSESPEIVKTPEQRRVERWQRFLAGLTPQAQLQLQLQGKMRAEAVEAEEACDFRRFRSALEPQARQQIDDGAAARDAAWPEGRKPRYCLVECEEGEWPVLRIFGREPEALVKRLAGLDGKDVCVYPFFGIPIPISKGPNRVVVLPDDTAWQVTPAVAMVDLAEMELPLQEDGFLGPPELAIVTDHPEPPEADAQAARRKRGQPPAAPGSEDGDANPDPAPHP